MNTYNRQVFSSAYDFGKFLGRVCLNEDVHGSRVQQRLMPTKDPDVNINHPGINAASDHNLSLPCRSCVRAYCVS